MPISLALCSADQQDVRVSEPPSPDVPGQAWRPEQELSAGEVPLFGGDVTDGIVRVGETVRRPQGPHSPLVHRVLRQLEIANFSGAPRFLGVDDQGREVLTFIDGDVATRPWPEWVADLDRAISVAVLVRALDDVMVAWGLPADGIVPELSPAGIPAAIGPGSTFIGHRDVTPENVVFREGRAVALIDFDLLKPSSRVDEVCNLLLWWAPLMPPQDREVVLRDQDAIARAARLVDAYGLAQHDRARVVDVAHNSADRTWFLMRARASRFGGGWQRMWDEGVGDRIIRRRDWLAENRDALHTAVMSAST